MARGGRRQGQPGQNYGNRKDLNMDRAVQPGSSAAPVPAPAARQAPAQPEPTPPMALTPDNTPSLDSPSMYPQRPVTTGLPSGPGTGPNPMSEYRISNEYNLLRAAARRNPSNPDIRRVVAYLAARGDNNA
jgi:hypothetical protein